MNAEVKAKWIDALRSGEYSQIKGWLRRSDGFCCLGVLCDISGRGTWNGNQFQLDGDHRQGALPQNILIAADLNRNTEETLAVMNDQGRSFAAIADWIEANL